MPVSLGPFFYIANESFKNNDSPAICFFRDDHEQVFLVIFSILPYPDSFIFFSRK